MLDIKAVYYLAFIMFILLLVILSWGWYSFAKAKTTIRFLNLKLLVVTLATGVVGLILSIVPLTMQIWTYDSEIIKSDAVLLSLLVLEYIFLVSLLALAYIFSFDFGIAVNENNIFFFGQSLNIAKIVALEQKKYGLKIVYEQGIKKIKKRLTVITPKGQLFVKTHLSPKVNSNITLENVSEIVDVDDVNSNDNSDQ